MAFKFLAANFVHVRRVRFLKFVSPAFRCSAARLHLSPRSLLRALFRARRIRTHEVIKCKLYATSAVGRRCSSRLVSCKLHEDMLMRG